VDALRKTAAKYDEFMLACNQDAKRELAVKKGDLKKSLQPVLGLC
jgi:hypothetical protein